MLSINGGRITIIGAWLIILVAVIACGQTQTPTPATEPASSPQRQASPISEPKPSPTLTLSPVDDAQWNSYRNEEFRYSIDIPPGWTVNDAAKDEIIITIGPLNGQAGLHALAFDFNTTIDEFVLENHLFHQRRAAALFESLSSTEIEMDNGETARRVAYRVQNDPSFCIEFLLDYLLQAGNLTYALQGSVCEDAGDLFGVDLEMMQRSFRLDSDLAKAHANSYHSSGVH